MTDRDTDKTINVHFEPPPADSPTTDTRSALARRPLNAGAQAPRERPPEPEPVVVPVELERANAVARAACGCAQCVPRGEQRRRGIDVRAGIAARTCGYREHLAHLLAELRAGKAVQP